MIEKVKAHHEKFPEAFWIEGRGWDQNDWKVKEFPTKAKLDEAFPDNPVNLTRIDGHAALVNSKALELAGIDASTKIDGGDVILKNILFHFFNGDAGYIHIVFGTFITEDDDSKHSE